MKLDFSKYDLVAEMEKWCQDKMLPIKIEQNSIEVSKEFSKEKELNEIRILISNNESEIIMNFI